jgi:hypothetical protein
MEENLMKLRLMSFAVLIALACAFVFAPLGATAAPKKANLLKNVPVSGALADGGTFNGRITITEFGYDQATGLTVSGVVKGIATKADGTTQKISQAFNDVHTSLTSGSGAAAAGFQLQASCQILNLDIGAIHLDLLGLVVDLSPINLDITAVSGAGNLLGNLLCAVAGLLDPNGFLTDLIGTLNQLLDLLNQINQIIG